MRGWLRGRKASGTKGLLAILLCVALAVPASLGGGVTTLTPSTTQVTGTVSQTWASADEALRQAGIPLGLPDTLTSLRANALAAMLDERLETYKQQLYSGILPLVDFDDVPLEDIGFQEGPLPTRAFYHTSSMEDVETRIEGSTGGIGAASTSSASLTDPATRERLNELYRAGLAAVPEVALRPLQSAAENASARMAALKQLVGPVALPQVQASATTLGALLFSDDFNDNSLAPTKWTVINAGYGVAETSARLQMSVRETQETQAYVRSTLIPQAFSSSTGVDATVQMARNVAGGAWVAKPSFTLVRSDDSAKWVRLGFEPFNNRIQLTDSAGTSTTLVFNNGGTTSHAFRLTVLGSEYTAAVDASSTTVTTSLFSGAPGVRVEFTDTTAGSSVGAWETSVRDDLYVYEAHTGGSTGDSYEPDNGFSEYVALSPTTSLQSQAHSLQPAGDEDYYRFYATSSNTYTFYATGLTDTFAHLYDSSHAQQAADDDSGDGNNFRLSYTPAVTGYHFLRVRGYSGSTAGDYTLYYTMNVPNGAPAAPSAPTGVAIALPATSYTYSTSATDPEGDNVRYMFDWGDGATTWTSFATSGSTLSATHSWAFGGTYYVYVMAEDVGGGASGWSPYKAVTVSASNGAPATPSVPSGPTLGQTEAPYTFAAAATDPDGDSLAYEFDWGDGTTSRTATAPSGATVNAAHTWASAARFSVRVRAIDGGDLASGWSPRADITIEVPAVPLPELEEGFEGALDGWVLDGLWDQTGRRADVGAKSLWYGKEPEGTYATGAQTVGSAVSPVFTVPASDPYLVFDSWYQTEPGRSYDAKTVSILSATGVPLQTFAPLSHPAQQWESRGYSLANQAGQDVRIQFHFDSGDANHNDYEGWYLDNVRVVGDDTPDEELSPEADTFTEITSEFVHDVAAGQSWSSYSLDDEERNTEHLARGANDRMTKYFEYHAQAHEGVSQAWLSVLAKSSGCTADTTYSHTLAVNGVPILDFEPCSWSSTAHESLGFEIPVNYLQEGRNSFTITDRNLGARGLFLGTDTHYPGADSDIVVNNGADNPGELMWTLWVDRNRDDYDMMYRTITYRQVDNEGMVTDLHGYEAFVYLSPEEMDTLYIKKREEPDGSSTTLWSDVVWQKNALFNTANQVPGWTHKVFDQNTESAPATGSYYSYFRTNWESKSDVAGAQPERGRYMSLVPCAPFSAEDKKTDASGKGKQNPPAQGKATADSNGWAINLKAEAYYRTHQTKSYSHKFWDPNDDHKHQEVGAGLHLLDIDERVAAFAEGMDIGLAVSDWVADFIKSKTVKEWLVKSLKIGLSGDIASYVLGFAQSGDIASVGLQEKDYGGSSAYTSLPVTVLSVVPPVVGWSLPIDVQVPVHLLPDIGDHTWSKTFFEHDF
ncbi:MAG: hypothetical protein QOD77_1256 [Thermoplasmata archaeon]|jgi:hypothetical protein|nr:hypothetical protein [Thermoplasmata archaeon]